MCRLVSFAGKINNLLQQFQTRVSKNACQSLMFKGIVQYFGKYMY